MDFITDESCRHLQRLNSLTEVPEFVKSSYVDPEAIAELKRNQFANPNHREFPIDEPGHVWLSYGYLKSAGLNAPVIEQRVKRAGELFGITAELEKLDAIFAEVKKASAATPAEPKYALSYIHDAEGKEEVRNYFPINTPEEIKKVAKDLCNTRHRVPLPLFVEACRNMVKAAADFSLARRDLPKLVWTYGEERLIDVEHIKFAGEQRVKLTGDDVYEDLVKLASDDEQDPEALIGAWLQADIQNGVRYDAQTDDPFQIFYSGATKAAADRFTSALVKLAGAPVPFAELAKVDQSALAKRLTGSAAAQAIALVKAAATAKSGAELDPLIQAMEPAVQRVFLAMAVAQAS